MALALAFLLAIMMVAPVAAQSGIEAEEAFYNTWARTDMPVADGIVDRTWMWGPQANTEVITEPYAEHPTGERSVQYWDKARMEVNNPNAEYDGLWYVTNGLLVVELMTGMMQVGHEEFVEHDPAMVNIAGDPGFADTPTYATYATLMDAAAWDEGATITATVDADGNVGADDTLGDYGVTAATMAPETGHRTASVFWEFMTSEGLIWDWETGETTTDRLFENAYYATGFPITEAYWAHIMVDGTAKWVLTQAFEHRVLTYTPDNDAGWQVEAGNVGLHYWEWRYETEPPGPDPVELTDQVLYTELSGDNEVPPVETMSSGSAIVWVTDDGSLHFQVMVNDIVDVTASHIHLAPEGENGPVVVPLFSGEFSGDGVLAEGTITADMLSGVLEGMTLEDLMAHMVAGNTYVNVHTAANPGGEIRGQLALTDDVEPPPPPVEMESFHVMFGALNESGVSGTAELTLDGDQLTVAIEASGLEADATHAQHIHGQDDGSQSICPTPDMAGDDGVLTLAEGLPAYGGVVIDLQPYPTADADGNITFEETFTLDDPSLDLSAHAIVLHGMTVGDEFVDSLPMACGVVMPVDGDVLMSELSGDNELPDPVESAGSGFATYQLNSAGDAIAYTLVVNGLTDVTAAHIHLEDEGADTGGVVVPLFATDVEESVASNGILASGVITADDLSGALEGMTLEDLMTAMVAGETYTNVHTVTNPPGELRGQIEAQGSATAGDHMH